MKFFLLVQLSIFVLSSCTENSSVDNKKDSLISKITSTKDKLLLNEFGDVCDSINLRKTIPWKDTICPNGVFVKYQVYKNYYDLKIGKAELDTLLGYQFDCKVSGNIVPWLKMSDNETVVLKRAMGSSAWIYFIYSFQENKIVFDGEYEIPFAIDLKAKRIAYAGTGDGAVVVVENFVTHSKKRFNIPFYPKYVSAGYNGKFRRNILEVDNGYEKSKTKIRLPISN